MIKAYGLGDGGIDDGEVARIDEIAEHISTTERTSMVAERNSVDRFTAAYLVDKIGDTFEGRISGVTRFGLFVSLNETGADGIVPMRSLKNDFYNHDEDQHALIGQRSGIIFRLGASVTVKLKEADGLTGSTVFEMTGKSVNGADIPGLVFKNKGGSQPRGKKPSPRKGPKKNFKKGKRRK